MVEHSPQILASEEKAITTSTVTVQRQDCLSLASAAAEFIAAIFFSCKSGL